MSEARRGGSERSLLPLSIDLANFNFCHRESSKRFSQYGECERNDKSQKFVPFPRYISAISKSNWLKKIAVNPPPLPPEILEVKRLELYGLKPIIVQQI